MTDPATQATIRAVFRSIPQGRVLRPSPKAKIEERAFREVLKPLEQYLDGTNPRHSQVSKSKKSERLNKK